MLPFYFQNNSIEFLHYLLKQIVLGPAPADMSKSITEESSFIRLNTTQNHRQLLVSCLNEMNSFAMKHAEKDKMFQLCCKIVDQMGEMNKEMLEQDTGMSPSFVVEATINFFSTEIGAYKTRRLREKQISNDRFYVEPQQKSVATRIELVYDRETQIEKQRRIQSTLQTVSIIRITIESYQSSR